MLHRFFFVFSYFSDPFPEVILAGPKRRPRLNFLLKSKYAYAHAADPVYSLRRNSPRHQTLEASSCRFYKVPIPWGGPKGSQGNPRGAQGAQGDPREPKGIQGNPRKTQRDPKGPKGAFGALAGVGQWGPLGCSEAIPNGKLFRVEGYYEWKATPK